MRFNLILAGLAISVIAGWGICWRRNLDWWFYVLTPVLVLISAVILPALAHGLAGWRKTKAGKWGAPLVAALLLVLLGKPAWDLWPEIVWGAPKLKGLQGNVMIFENGSRRQLPLMEITPDGVADILKLKGERLTLAEIQGAAFGAAWKGFAKGADASTKFAEGEARKLGYGMWGGGSVQRDYEILEALRTRHGDAWIRDALRED
jgi:hypothetical protein